MTKTYDQEVRALLENSQLTLEGVGAELGLSYKQVYRVWKTYPKEWRKARKVQNYSRSKLGELNPMKGKLGVEHHNYKGVIDDNKGYKIIIKPEWYTGRQNSKHVFYHHVVLCEAMGLTEIPEGHHVHHCDHDPHNNEFSNLVLLTDAEHMSLHQNLQGSTTISKESTLKWVEARRAGNSYDIV